MISKKKIQNRNDKFVIALSHYFCCYLNSFTTSQKQFNFFQDLVSDF